MSERDRSRNDFTALLAPISEAAPAGTSLRYDRVYDLIREARREEDPSLPLGEWTRKLKVADWVAVERLCTEALTTRSKDLRIAAWLADAWARSGGLDGVARGLRLFAALVERYWESGFPALEEDGLEARISLLDWMDDLIASAVRRTPIGETSQQPLTYEDWERAERGLPSLHTGEDGQPLTPDALRSRGSMLGVARWRVVRAGADSASRALADVHAALAAKTEQAPVLRKLRDGLAGVARLAREITGERDMPAPAESRPGSPDPADPEGPGSPSFGGEASDDRSGPLGPIRDRTEAYLRLSEAADYLLRTEPHSPVPYLIKRAVGWGNMSLAELLMELVGTPDDLVAIQRLLGMRGRE